MCILSLLIVNNLVSDLSLQLPIQCLMGFAGDSVVKNPPANEGDMGSISGQEDPTCYRTTKASSHNCFAATKMIKE